jgi:hypothetical protein
MEIARKIEIALDYPEMKQEVEHAREVFGLDAFRIECLRPVRDVKILQGWKTDKPYYEIYGEQQIASGHYKQLITFNQHMRPIGEELFAFATDFDFSESPFDK